MIDRATVELVDDLAKNAGEKVLVVGSLPPDARDLDVLASPKARDAIGEGLAKAGFIPKGRQWARFAGAPAQVVDLVSGRDLGVSARHAREAIGAAVPVEGLKWLVRPAVHHALLLRALRVKRSGSVRESWRAAALAVATDDPAALDRALQLARRWGVRRELDVLLGRAAPRGRRIAVRGRLRMKAMRRSFVVALSGVDGSGKSEQARRLADTLTGLGVDVDIAWSRLGYQPILQRLASPMRPRASKASRDVPSSEIDGGSRSRSGGVLRTIWALVVALVAVVDRLGSVLRARARGKALIRDRYVLDAVVELEIRYEGLATLPAARWVTRAFAPRVTCGFLLDVPAEEAFARKPHKRGLVSLQRSADLYRKWCEACGVTRLDGTLPAEAIADRIAAEVWRRMP